jgi:adenosine deaminase
VKTVLNYNQQPLFETADKAAMDTADEAAMMNIILSMPKVDLHRHLTGAIDAEIAVRVGAKHNVKLPTYISSDLHDILYNHGKVSTLKEYFTPWPILNKLFITRESTHDLILEVVRKASEDGVIYTEFRTGPHGFLGKDENKSFTFEEYVETVAESAAEAEELYGTVVRFILGIPRHVFGPISAPKRNWMLDKIVAILSTYRSNCFVGVDLNGDEAALGADPKDFETFFSTARAEGFKVTIHAGECGPASNVEYAACELGASRIGHGIAAATDPKLLSQLARQRCMLEICPTSNELLGLVGRTEGLPLRILHDYGVPYSICTDNPARCRTSLSEELFKVAKAFDLPMEGIREITCRAVEHSFADENTKRKLHSKICPDAKSGLTKVAAAG